VPCRRIEDPGESVLQTVPGMRVDLARGVSCRRSARKDSSGAGRPSSLAVRDRLGHHSQAAQRQLTLRGLSRPEIEGSLSR
jgi:hypothetical protein